MTKFYSGIAGARPGKAKGVVIHNDAGSPNANAAFYRNWLPTHDAEVGFAHVYIASDGRFQAESYNNQAWHTANSTGNTWYVGWEVCQSMGDESIFLNNEQKVFKDVAEYMKSVGMTPSRETVKLHNQFYSTACPHRSWALHVGQGAPYTATNQAKLQDYFISQINKYLNANTDKNTVQPTTSTTTTKKGGFAMFIYWVPRTKGSKVRDGYIVWGDNRRHIPNSGQLTHYRKLIKANGGDITENTWEKGSDQLLAVEAVTTLVK